MTLVTRVVLKKDVIYRPNGSHDYVNVLATTREDAPWLSLVRDGDVIRVTKDGVTDCIPMTSVSYYREADEEWVQSGSLGLVQVKKKKT